MLDKMIKEYRMTSPYGPRRDPITGQATNHTGVDLVKAHKSPILAFVAGEVVNARMGLNGTGFGNVVTVRDKNGNTQIYAHLDSISVKVGDIVLFGQEVGKQGTTGRSTGSHLHYEIRLNGQFGRNVEPLQYTRKLYEELIAVSNNAVSVGNTTIKVGNVNLQGIIINGVSFAPVAAMAEAVGKKAQWNAQTKTVEVK
jgi:hypothetical protein